MKVFKTGLALLLVLSSGALYAQVQVVVSIRPLELVVTQLLGERGTTRLLIPASQSPHHFVLAPSDRLALQSARLIVTVGEELETGLHSALQGLPARERILEAAALPGLTLHALSGHAAHGGNDNPSRIDPHLWLDTGNVALLAQAIASRLVEIDPSGAPDYQANLQQFMATLATHESRWREQLLGLENVPYVVYHDGIAYFEAQFGFHHALVLIDDPEIQPGARHILSVRQQLGEIAPRCVFSDVTARTGALDTLVSDRSVRRVELDLLGSRLAAGADYVSLIDRLVDDFAACLAGAENG